MIHVRHRWVTVETIGRVIIQYCAICGKTRIKIR